MIDSERIVVLAQNAFDSDTAALNAKADTKLRGRAVAEAEGIARKALRPDADYDGRKSLLRGLVEALLSAEKTHWGHHEIARWLCPWRDKEKRLGREDRLRPVSYLIVAALELGIEKYKAELKAADDSK